MSKKIGIITMEAADLRPKNTVGSSRIRVRWLLPYWEEAEEFVVGKNYEVMIYQKVYWANSMKQFEGIKILDLCDPDWLEKKPVFEFIDLADAVTTSTLQLKEYIQKLRPGKPVLVVPDRLEFNELTPRAEHEGRAKKAVWFGFHNNVHYVQKAFDALIRMGFELTIISDQAYNTPAGYRNLNVQNIPYSYPDVYKELKRHDVAVLPSPDDDERGKFKSNNKTILCWALGLPVATTEDELKTFLDPEKRNEEVKKRSFEIAQEYNVTKSVEQYRELIKYLEYIRNGYTFDMNEQWEKLFADLGIKYENQQR